MLCPSPANKVVPDIGLDGELCYEKTAYNYHENPLQNLKMFLNMGGVFIKSFFENVNFLLNMEGVFIKGGVFIRDPV